MSRQLLGAAFGALILASSGCALVDDRIDPFPFPRSYSGDGERWGRPGPHLHEYSDHDFHDRWHPRPSGYSRPVPNWDSHYRYERRWGHAYGDHGVTTTLRGRDN